MANESPTTSRFVLLRPAPDQESEGSEEQQQQQQQQSHPRRLSRSNEPLPPRRRLVAVACDNCRSKRTKCGGQRPSCNTCLSRGEKCSYEAREGETVTASLKRRLRELEDDNTSYKELYRLLKSRPESESEEILRRIRSTEDPLEVYRFLKEAELLLTGSSAPPTAPAASWSSAGSESDGMI